MFRIRRLHFLGTNYQQWHSEAVEGRYLQMKKIKVVDIFCGAGGASTGISQAIHTLGRDIELIAVDQWRPAIETHQANHPEARHICMPVEDVQRDSIPAPFLLWASPPCIDHSPARGARPKSSASQGLAWEVIRWAKAIQPTTIIIENVPQFLNWGDLNDEGYPMEEHVGRKFKQWSAALASLGYWVDWRILMSADYGDPTTRRRLYVQATRRRITWPVPSHAESDGLFPARPWIPAIDIIDPGITGRRVYGRKNPLSEKTIQLIQSMLRDTEMGQHDRSKFIMINIRGERRSVDIKKPFPTITGSNTLALVRREQINRRSELTLRFLTPEELAKGQGFPATYQFVGSKRQVIKQIGNAVTVNTAKALANAVIWASGDKP